MSLRVSPGRPLDLPRAPRAPTTSATLRDRGFVHCRQRQLSWCWAACICGVDSISGRGRIREVWEVVEAVTGLAGCQEAPPHCRKSLAPSSIPGAWKRASYSGRPEHRPLSFPEIQREIGQGRAVEAFLRAQAHYVLVIGWTSNAASQEMVDVSDPARSKPTLMAYSKLISAYQGGWSDSFVEIAARTGSAS